MCEQMKTSFFNWTKKSLIEKIWDFRVIRLYFGAPIKQDNHLEKSYWPAKWIEEGYIEYGNIENCNIEFEIK